jgi:nucleotide-binding universal stress UspA family protein
LASLLPSDIAQRCHALPIAVEGKRVTVAMAHPDDTVARQAVVDSLGSETCVVQANPQEMERMLNELWPSNAESKLHFMSWSPTSEIATEVEPYAQAFTHLLDARLTSLRDTETGHRYRKTLAAEVQCQQPDLIIFHNPVKLFPIWLMPGSVKNHLIKHMPVSLLVTRSPRWPLQKILLLLRDSIFDAAAIKWVVRIASKSAATVSTLPLLAPVPPIFAGMSLEQRSLIHLLSSTCPLGKTLRQVSKCLTERNIQGTLRLREGSIIEQIQQEVDEYDYDFIVIAADTGHSIMRWLMGELVNPLLSLAEVPILIAKPI